MIFDVHIISLDIAVQDLNFYAVTRFIYKYPWIFRFKGTYFIHKLQNVHLYIVHIQLR